MLYSKLCLYVFGRLRHVHLPKKFNRYMILFPPIGLHTRKLNSQWIGKYCKNSTISIFFLRSIHRHPLEAAAFSISRRSLEYMTLAVDILSCKVVVFGRLFLFQSRFSAAFVPWWERIHTWVLLLRSTKLCHAQFPGRQGTFHTTTALSRSQPVAENPAPAPVAPKFTTPQQ